MTERTEVSGTPTEILVVEDSPVEAELLRRTLIRQRIVQAISVEQLRRVLHDREAPHSRVLPESRYLERPPAVG